MRRAGTGTQRAHLAGRGAASRSVREEGLCQRPARDRGGRRARGLGFVAPVCGLLRDSVPPPLTKEPCPLGFPPGGPPAPRLSIPACGSSPPARPPSKAWCVSQGVSVHAGVSLACTCVAGSRRGTLSVAAKRPLPPAQSLEATALRLPPCPWAAYPCARGGCLRSQASQPRAAGGAGTAVSPTAEWPPACGCSLFCPPGGTWPFPLFAGTPRSAALCTSWLQGTRAPGGERHSWTLSPRGCAHLRPGHAAAPPGRALRGGGVARRGSRLFPGDRWRWARFHMHRSLVQSLSHV